MDRKPLLLLGDSISPESAAILKRDGMFETVGASMSKFQSDEHFFEPFYGEGGNFADNAEKIRGNSAFVVQSTGAPVGDHVQHLLEMIHTLKYYGAREVTAIVPFMAYSRQDRAFPGRFTSVAADLMARQLQAAGADRIVTFSMHSQDSVNVYRDAFGDNFVPVSATNVFAQYLQDRFGATVVELAVGAPDGAEKPKDEGQKRARELAEALTGQFNAAAMFRISKVHTAASETKITAFEGDVKDKDCVIIDDMVDGGTTMLNAAKMLKAQGARSVTCCFTHAILTKGNGSALEKLMTAKDERGFAIDRLAMTDSIPEAAQKISAFALQYPDLAAKIDMLPLGPTILAYARAQNVPAAKPSAPRPN